MAQAEQVQLARVPGAADEVLIPVQTEFASDQHLFWSYAAGNSPSLGEAALLLETFEALLQ